MLLQRDGRRKTVNRVNIRLAHLIDQPPRIGRHRIEIAALRFRKQRRECER